MKFRLERNGWVAFRDDGTPINHQGTQIPRVYLSRRDAELHRDVLYCGEVTVSPVILTIETVEVSR